MSKCCTSNCKSKQQLSIWETKPEVVKGHYIMAALTCEKVTHALLSLSAAFSLSSTSAQLRKDVLVKKRSCEKNGREPSQSGEKENGRKESCCRYESKHIQTREISVNVRSENRYYRLFCSSQKAFQSLYEEERQANELSP